eukprot:6994705-Prymnesium_polylepis.1
MSDLQAERRTSSLRLKTSSQTPSSCSCRVRTRTHALRTIPGADFRSLARRHAARHVRHSQRKAPRDARSGGVSPAQHNYYLRARL